MNGMQYQHAVSLLLTNYVVVTVTNYWKDTTKGKPHLKSREMDLAP